MKSLNRKEKKRVVLAAVAVASILFYLSPLRLSLAQELSTRLFYVPILLGALWFGFRGGFETVVLVTLICAPHALRTFGRNPILFYDEVLELFLFNVTGILVGILRDRERRQIARNLELQALAAIGEAVSTVAHEIKNILIPIRGFLRRTREAVVGDGKAASYLEIVEKESARLDSLVRDMLVFGRFSPLKREETELGWFMDELRVTLAEEFRHQGIRLKCLCPNGEKRVSLDPEKVRHALINLLQNALHASQRDHEVRLSFQCGEKDLEIAVEDEGIGIPPEHLDRIFKPFFTTKPQGNGLGLAIAQRVVLDHGGKIRVVSTPGTGTRFLLSFPLTGHPPLPSWEEPAPTSNYR
jgi:two-component system, NtrC family, sensor histidine kinase HydH